MTSMFAATENSSNRIRRFVLTVVAVAIGVCGTSLTSEYARIVRSSDFAMRSLDARALALLLGPGIAGVGLIVAALLLMLRRRFALGVYWSAVLVAIGFEGLSRFGCLAFSTPPGGQMQAVFIEPDHYDSILWTMREASLLGVLVLVGVWATEPRESEVESAAVGAG